MAEIVGVVSGTVTLCGLLGKCLDAFDMIKAGKTQEFALRKLLVRLNIERVRLYTWGKAVGVAEPSWAAKSDHIDHERVFKDTLQIIIQLLLDADNIQTRYGCCQEADVADPETADPIDYLAAPFSNLDISAGVRASKTKSLLSKTRWVIRDKDKFEELIAEVKSYVDGIYDITKSLDVLDAAEKSARDGLYQIDDLETLEMVSVACQVDYPSFSDAASVKVEVVSQSTSRKNEIGSWIGKLTRSSSQEMLQVPFISNVRRRVGYHDRSVAKITQEATMDIETLISPLTEEETNRVDKAILQYLDYRDFGETARMFRSELQGEKFGDVFIEKSQRMLREDLPDRPTHRYVLTPDKSNHQTSYIPTYRDGHSPDVSHHRRPSVVVIHDSRRQRREEKTVRWN